MALVLAMLPAGFAEATGTSQRPLEAKTSHKLAVPVFEGPYMLAWQSEIKGDINGYIEWWLETENWTAFPPDPNSPPPPVSHFIGKTRIYDKQGGKKILEAIGQGETNMTTSTWWANDQITYADPDLFPGWKGRGVQEEGEFTFATTPPEGTSTFKMVTEPIVTGMVLVDAATDKDVGPLWPGTIINKGTTPHFNIRLETAPSKVGSVGFKVVDSDGKAPHYRLDRKHRENVGPYAVGGDYPVGDYLHMPLHMDEYRVQATAYTKGNMKGMAGPKYEVDFAVGKTFKAELSGQIVAITTDPANVQARCNVPSWAYVGFTATGKSGLLGSFTAEFENCSYVGELPDGTIGPNGTYGEGILKITAENGDVIKGTYQRGITLEPAPIVKFTDEFTFTGGTGRFANVIGGGTEIGVSEVTADFVGSPFTLEMEGVIAY